MLRLRKELSRKSLSKNKLYLCQVGRAIRQGGSYTVEWAPQVWCNDGRCSWVQWKGVSCFCLGTKISICEKQSGLLRSAFLRLTGMDEATMYPDGIISPEAKIRLANPDIQTMETILRKTTEGFVLT